MTSNKLILVSGAPRSATTPVGNMLATARGTVSLYEPLGITGLQRINVRFPMTIASDGLTTDGLKQIANDLGHKRSGGLRKQQRMGGFSMKRAVFGTRTLHSFRMARLQPWARNVIWKDPHAIMLVPDVVELGIDVIVTVRRALAHAASYQRLGWVSQASSVYPRWAERFGPCEICENAIPEAEDTIISAALLWRMSYLPLLRTGAIDKVSLVTSDRLMESERETYEALFNKLGLEPSSKTEAELSKQKSDTRSRPKGKVTHDWGRSVKAVNSYWSEVLSEEQIERVKELTADVEDGLFRA